MVPVVAQEFDRKAYAQYEAPIVAVGDMAGDQHQEEWRHELHEAD